MTSVETERRAGRAQPRREPVARAERIQIAMFAGLVAIFVTTREIRAHVEELYGVTVSRELSKVTRDARSRCARVHRDQRSASGHAEADRRSLRADYPHPSKSGSSASKRGSSASKSGSSASKSESPVSKSGSSVWGRRANHQCRRADHQCRRANHQCRRANHQCRRANHQCRNAPPDAPRPTVGRPARGGPLSPQRVSPTEKNRENGWERRPLAGTARRRRAEARVADREESRERLGTPASGRHARRRRAQPRIAARKKRGDGWERRTSGRHARPPGRCHTAITR